MPSSHDGLLLEQLLDTTDGHLPALLEDGQSFDYFAIEHTLKDYDLSVDEIVAGITDGGSDGGVDGFYTFADENLVDEDFDSTVLPSGYSLDVYIFQNKTRTSFGEDALDKLQSSLPILLNLTASLDPSVYSAALIRRAEIFRAQLSSTARKFPQVNIYIVYSTKGTTDELSAGVKTKAERLKSLVMTVVGAESICNVDFQGARELLVRARREPAKTLELRYESNASHAGQNSYTALVPLKSYAEFLTDDSGRLKKFIFESNVRDFQGNTQVNAAIRESLSSTETESSPDFWWLNNGITMLCDQVTIAGGKFIVKNPQIVNGLQTSVSVYNHFKSAPKDVDDSRLIIVKIIESTDEEVRNEVIVATNSQTSLLPSAIRAADDMQRDIEQYFLGNDLYYDRRKNYYKNLGKPANSIVSVPYLAQAILSIGYSEPDQARARPSSLLRKDADYKRIFNSTTPLETYLWVAKVQRSVDEFIKKSHLGKDLKTNMRFHLSMLVGRYIVGEVVNDPYQLSDSATSVVVSDEILQNNAEILMSALDEFMVTNPDYSVDRIAKSREFVEYLIHKMS